jgi:hypothetical protein
LLDTSTSKLAKVSKVLASANSISNNRPSTIVVACDRIVITVEPVLRLMDASIKAIDGIFEVQNASLIRDLAISLICPQVLVAATNGTSLFIGKKLKSYIKVGDTEQSNYQTAVLIAPEDDPQQINILQNKSLTGIDPQTDEPYSLSKVINLSMFGESGPFINISLLGGDQGKGNVYVHGTSYLGILAYNTHSASFEKPVIEMMCSLLCLAILKDKSVILTT